MTRLSWLALKSVPGVGNHLYKRLIKKFQTPENVFQASVIELNEIEGLSLKVATAIRHYKVPASVEEDYALSQKKGYRILVMNDPDYPSLLNQLPDPPPCLYVLGRLGEDAPKIAVVGARSSTEYGMTIAQQLSRELAQNGLQIVSGMARGIDTAAHRGAILGHGQTIAVLGSGLGRIYPPENTKLYYQIAENGAVISEFPITTPPMNYHFPLRNRMISGLSLGTLVVEASLQSGSLITARLAAGQGREVFAVPGSIRSSKSKGTHRLIKQGAKLVETVEDVLEELMHLFPHAPLNTHKAMPIKNRTLLPIDENEAKVLKALEPYPMHVDEIKRSINMPSGELAGVLLNLELKGIVMQSPGKLFSMNEDYFE